MNIDELFPEIQPPEGGLALLRARLRREATSTVRPLRRRLVLSLGALGLMMILVFVPWTGRRVSYEDLIHGEPGARIILGMTQPEKEPALGLGASGRLMPIHQTDQVLIYQRINVPPPPSERSDY